MNRQVQNLSQTAQGIQTAMNKNLPLIPPSDQSATEYLKGVADGKNYKKREKERIKNRLELLK